MMAKRTLSLPNGASSQRRKSRLSEKIYRPYVDRGRPGSLRCDQDGGVPAVKDPDPVRRVMLTLQSMRRHNTIQPALQPTHRMLLRWAEGGGNGLPNPEAEIRETHYDPLPPDLQTKVDDIVEDSPWVTFARKYYRTNLTNKELVEQLCISRSQLYSDLSAMLWYFTGRFEATDIYE